MKNVETLLALPAALLSIVAVHAQQLQWPHNLPRTVKYYPEDEAHMQRESAAQERLGWHAPAGVKKMGHDDEGEKFFLDYWGFDNVGVENEGGSAAGAFRVHVPLQSLRDGNASIVPPLFPAIAPHMCDTHSKLGHHRRGLVQRDFQCPANTYSCSSIGHDNLCCNNGETCVETSDGVGCCPRGASCGQDVSGCESGYTSCPNSPNGGCCIPGASCEGTGCVLLGTRTVTQTLATTTKTSGASFTTETSSGRTITVVIPTTDISVSTQTVTISANGQTSTQTVTIGSTCKSGAFLCPASLGGGCCPNGQSCANDGKCPDSTTTTTATARAPVLPTSQTVTIQGVSSSSTQLAGCPTGYYMCSAVYLGGCCRVGRNCQTTSCPPQDTATLVTSGRTIYVTGPNGAAATGGSCANGWYACGADQNGGCCPSGYQCGVQSCKATNSGQRDTAKMAVDNVATVQRWAWTFLGIGLMVGVGMIWL